MKKLLVVLTALFCLMACTKDGSPAKSLYKNSDTINGVFYELNIINQGEDYSWTVINKTDEVALKYTFNYERKSDLQKDFAELEKGVKGFDESLLPVFSTVLRFSNDEDHEITVYRSIEEGNVFVKFIVGPKEFVLPYRFIVEGNNALNPKQ